MGLRALDVSDWGFFTFTGEDAKTFLQGLVTADVAALKPGERLDSCVLTPKGLLVADFELYDRGADLLAVTRPAAAGGFFDAFRAKILLARSAFERVRPRACLVLGEGFAGGLPWRRLDGPARLLLDAAPPADAAPLTPAEFHARRVAAGLPWFGVDMDGGTLPLEARQEPALSRTKGCYMGQETVSRILNRGHVNRRLARLRFAGAAPAAGAAVTREGAEAGRVTSAAGPWALAMLRAEAAAPSTRLTGGGVEAEVVD
jgi:folate-binding protein YgfZ